MEGKLKAQTLKEKIKCLLDLWSVKSYSQEGEDLILKRIFENKTDPGFYVDVGAHHPMRYSNTYLFYKQGWSGVNIDAAPGSMEVFRKYRPNDINVEAAISDEETDLTYYMFNDGALNTLSKEQVNLVKKSSGDKFYITKEVPVKTKRLGQILEENIPEGKAIDFMNVDVEGLDLQVLKSNNWEKYRPKYILVESYKSDTGSNEVKNEIQTLLEQQGYKQMASTVNTSVYSL